MHITKFKQKNLKAIFKHYTREHLTDNVIEDKIKDNVLLYNDDFEKNYLNSGKYDLTKKYIKSTMLRDYVLDTIEKRTGRKLRADQNVLCDVIITQPKEIPNSIGYNYNISFFQKVIKGLQDFEDNKGKKVFANRVMMAIHQDEQGQPHLHYSYLPIYDREKTRIKENKNKKTDKVYKINTKERLTCDYLNEGFLLSFHKKMEELTGLKLTKGDGVKRDLTMKEYQQQEELKKQEERIKENEKKIESNKNIITEQEKQLDNKLLEKENKLKQYKDTIDKYDYYYKTHNKIELKKPTEIKPKIIKLKENEILLDRVEYNNMIKQVKDLEFATSNDYNKRWKEKERLDNDIAEKEKKLESLNNNDLSGYKQTIEEQKETRNKLNTSISSKENTIANYEKDIKEIKSDAKKILKDFNDLTKENNTIKKVLKDNNVLDTVMNMVSQLLKQNKDRGGL